MFSELQPRYRFVMRKTQPIPPYIATQQRETLVRKITEPHENAVLGANRLKYFHRFLHYFYFYYFLVVNEYL